MNPGDLVGPYRIKASLGRGGMGEVYSAIHERIGLPVALKLLTHEASDSRARFVKEARALSLLEHPGVVRVFALETTEDDTPYLVMEQVSGCSLRDLMSQEGSIPLSRAISIVAQVASVMAAVHKSKIIHRDLKPENLMLVATDLGVDAIKVIDFGIAHVPSQSWNGPDTVVETKKDGPRWMGSVAYMSPEQCRQSSDVGPKADVYALGIILYELVCQKVPFGESEPVALAAQHLHQIPDLSRIEDVAIRKLLARMLDKTPDRRPEMEAVACTLGRHRPVDPVRRLISRWLPVAAGLLVSGAAAKVWRTRTAPYSLHKKSRPTAIDGPQGGVFAPWMNPTGWILIDHMEQGIVSQSEMLSTLPENLRGLPSSVVRVPPCGVSTSNDFRGVERMLGSWFAQTLEPLLRHHPEHRVVYFGIAPIAVMMLLGALVRALRPVEVRLRHHEQRRFLPWREDGKPAMLLPPRWKSPKTKPLPQEERDGEAVIRIATSHVLNDASIRRQVPNPICEVELTLSSLGEDIFTRERDVTAVAEAWKQTLDQLVVRFPRMRRVHLFGSVQAGLAFLLGTRISDTMHPMIQTYHYRAGEHRPALLLNQTQTG